MPWVQAEGMDQPDTQLEGSAVVIGAKLRPPVVRAMPRERLDRRLAGVWDHRCTIVAGPAGSGKTTLLAGFVAGQSVPTAWYCPDGEDGDVATLLAHLQSAFGAALGTEGDWRTVADMVIALERWTGARGLLVVDDVHTLRGTGAEAALERLVEYAPPWLHVLVASRQAPGWNTSRMRVSGELLEIGPDDLRFRSWEVERLFWDFYRERLPPHDVAELARATEGWAAVLQLFHLATAQRSPAERRRTVAALATRSRLVREYLTRNVLHDLPPELADFLLDTAVLGRLTARLCDRLLGRSHSLALLKELEDRQLLITRVEDGESFRYHEVLRTHLQAVLAERLGEAALRARFARAAALLEEEGLLADAVRAYCQAERWESVARILHRAGDRLTDPATWLDDLPTWLLEGDPWVLVATARRAAASGRWEAAMDGYRQAEESFAGAAGAEVCRREAAALAAWTEPGARWPLDWTGQARRLVAGEHRRGAGPEERAPAGPGGRLVAAMSALLAGQVEPATRALREVADDPGCPPVLAAGARLCAAAAPGLLPGFAPVATLHRPPEGVEQEVSPWLWRIARAATALSGADDGIREAHTAAIEFERDGDRWGAAFARWLHVLGALAAGTALVAEAAEVAERFRSLEAGALEAWARVALVRAMVRAGDPERDRAVRSAARLAESVGLPAVRHALDSLSAARDGPAKVPVAGRNGNGARPMPSSVALRCLGGFHLLSQGQEVHLGELKPRARSALRFLAMNADRPVHVETILAALWPELDIASGKRTLQVTLSSIRKVLSLSWGLDSALRREGDAYQLVVPEGASVDLVVFARGVADGRQLLRGADTVHSARAFATALDTYRGDLFPEEGPAEWVVERRRQLRAEAAAAAFSLAELLLSQGEAAEAAARCERGLEIDRYHDGLWRLLVVARERTDDVAGAARARRDYEGVLAELGVQAPDLRTPGIGLRRPL